MGKIPIDKWKLVVAIAAIVIPLGGAASATYLSTKMDALQASVVEKVRGEVSREYATKESVNDLKSNINLLRTDMKEGFKEVKEMLKK